MLILILTLILTLILMLILILKLILIPILILMLTLILIIVTKSNTVQPSSWALLSSNKFPNYNSNKYKIKDNDRRLTIGDKR